MSSVLRWCLRDPEPVLFEAWRMLNEAADHFLAERHTDARQLIWGADLPEVRSWIEASWGKGYQQWHLRRPDPEEPPALPKEERKKPVQPTAATKAAVCTRDGYLCRYCRLPVIDASCRALLARAYPDELPWGSTNASQHAAFQALWLQFDHVVPHSRGGSSEPDNVVVSCAACNFCKEEHTLPSLGIWHPDKRPIMRLEWDGLTRLLQRAQKLAARPNGLE